MDVRLSFAFISLIAILLGACTQQKTTESVFPANAPQSQKSQCASNQLQGRFIVHWENGDIQLIQTSSTDKFVKEFLDPQIDSIKYVDFDRKIKAIQPLVAELQEGTDVTPKMIPDLSVGLIQEYWGQQIIQVPDLWKAGVYGDGVVVAVVDSGVDITHPQLQTRLAMNSGETGLDANGKDKATNGIDDDGDSLVDDVYGWDFNKNSPNVTDVVGHGTHVAGVILADHDKGPMMGLAPKAKLLPLNFMSADGGGTLSDAIKAMEYASYRGAKIINASWGGAECTESLKLAIQKLESKGVLFVTASGNDGIDVDVKPEYPSSYNLPNQINVGASTSLDITAGFSNYGYKNVHIMAPGYKIMSTYPGNTYKSMDGTSMAAPFVSGAAALLWSAKSTASLYEIKQAILNSVDTGYFPVATHGRLNVKKAWDGIK